MGLRRGAAVEQRQCAAWPRQYPKQRPVDDLDWTCTELHDIESVTAAPLCHKADSSCADDGRTTRVTSLLTAWGEAADATVRIAWCIALWHNRPTLPRVPVATRAHRTARLAYNVLSLVLLSLHLAA